MKEESIDIKLRLPRNGIYSIIMKRLGSLRKTQIKLIKFPDVFSKLGTSLQLKKEEVWELLILLQDLGLISIITNHGIILNFEGLENGNI